MKILYHQILPFFILVFVLNACNTCINSNKVEQRIIFPSYFAQYDAATQTLTATATFQTDNESGNYIRLSSDSYVFCNQDNMEQKSDKEHPCYYFLEKKNISCPDMIQFNYNNDNGVIFNNKLIIKTIQISDILLNKDQDNFVKYKGSPIDENETISVILTKNDYQYEFQPDITDDNILIINASMLRDLKAGDYNAYLVRTSYSTSVKAMDRGGNAETNYHSRTYKITIQ